MTWRKYAKSGQGRRTGRTARATGQTVEAQVEAANAHYAATKRAHMVKRPTPYRQIGATRPDGKFTGQRVRAAGVDYTGVIAGGRHVALEVKSTSAAALPLTRQGKATLPHEQRRELTRVTQAGGLALILVRTTHQLRGRQLHRWWLLTWSGYLDAEDSAGKRSAQSISAELLGAHGVEVTASGLYGTGWPEWLEALEALGQATATTRVVGS